MNSENRLKILFLAAWYPSKENPVEGIFIKEHAKAVALYNDVTVIAFTGNSRSFRRLYKVSENIEDGIRTLRIKCGGLPIPKTKDLIRWWSVISVFRKMLKEGCKPDIIHAHVYSAGVPAIILGKMYGLPVVVTEHFSGFPRRLMNNFSRMQAKFAFERASLVCPVSKNLKDSIESYGIQARFKVIPNVVDTSLFSPQEGPNLKKTEGSGKKRMLLTALLTPIKGVPYLLEALSRLKKKRSDFILDIVGDGPNRSEYEETVRELGLSDFVRFHGLKTKQEVAGFMKRCDFFVLPSLWENLPCVLIEAMASGNAIIATDVGGIKEMVNKEVGILIPSKDIRSLETSIGYMLDNHDNYSSERIAKYAKERFSYEAVGQLLNNIYRELINEYTTEK